MSENTVTVKGILLLSLLFMGINSAFAKCYPGLDCPDDIPDIKQPRPYNPPPAPPTAPAPVQPEADENCGNPYLALLGSMLGQPTVCTQPATQCCFQDGSAVPLVHPGSIRFGDPCYAVLFGVMPVQGLGCRR